MMLPALAKNVCLSSARQQKLPMLASMVGTRTAWFKEYHNGGDKKMRLSSFPLTTICQEVNNQKLLIEELEKQEKAFLSCDNTTYSLWLINQLYNVSNEICSLKKDLKKLESKKKEILNKFEFCVQDTHKIKFCLVDVLRPAILEVPLPLNYILTDRRIEADILPEQLRPLKADRKCSLDGSYVRWGTQKFIYAFLKTLRASSATLNQFSFGKQLVPKFVDDIDRICQMKPLDLPRLYISTGLLPKEMVLDIYDSSSDLDGFVKSLKSNIEIKPVKANCKDMLIKWLKSSGIFNKYKVMGNNRALDGIGVSLYHKSRPDFCLIPKEIGGTPSGIAYVHVALVKYYY
ncbi:PREDICTED: uncharacterized protein LOC109585454 [Amphimedon queenslandica]|uniref:Uncharacterized protein n=1 Tax=Amphimedon queenslandica TaxID=400682 RepID=A0AAN0JJE5_AMPQE|nr:PREDICTED: uncharacterized protein LOC109585454 [Amphimedon queenslandica]|eukprot:XP_019857099.1 PREDICTED: uncharacterized protein LOC109585454 [Amphimedon queenslandica]